MPKKSSVKLEIPERFQSPRLIPQQRSGSPLKIAEDLKNPPDFSEPNEGLDFSAESQFDRNHPIERKRLKLTSLDYLANPLRTESPFGKLRTRSQILLPLQLIPREAIVPPRNI